MSGDDLKQEVYRRERVIDVLELAASVPEQLEYQENVPIAQVPSEVICGWEDWMGSGGARIADCREPVWSFDEVAALHSFEKSLDEICSALPNPLPARVEEIADHPAWRCLCETAGVALAVMRRRGRNADPHS